MHQPRDTCISHVRGSQWTCSVCSHTVPALTPPPPRYILDDFREAYYWLRHNTKPDARIMSWWDYGYQITAMGNRTIIVDNNTWNNTHIATVRQHGAAAVLLAGLVPTACSMTPFSCMDWQGTALSHPTCTLQHLH